MAGRNLKLTDDLQKNICHILEAGTSIKDACALVGIGDSTFHEWVAIGNAHRNGEDHPRMPRKIADRDRFADFAESTTRARAKMRDDVVKSLTSFAKAGNTQAAMFLLERTDPENWGRQTKVKLDVNITLIQEFVEALKQSGQQPDQFMQRVIERARNEQHVH